jgi:hypothetical protein
MGLMFNGPWHVIDKKTLEQRPRPAPGEIIKHRSGAVVLCCPVCNAMQFAHAPITGTDDAPTIAKPIQCGAGNCKRCGIWFSIDAGKTVVVAGPTDKLPREMPTKLVDAGVKPPPKLPDELR